MIYQLFIGIVGALFLATTARILIAEFIFLNTARKAHNR